jgi:hypothetical protein
MDHSIWAAVSEDRGRGAHCLADQSTRHPWPRGNTGPTRARILEMAMHRAANLIADGMSPATAANRAIHEHGMRFQNSAHVAETLVKMATDATIRAAARRPQPRRRSEFQIPRRITLRRPPGVDDRTRARHQVRAYALALRTQNSV